MTNIKERYFFYMSSKTGSMMKQNIVPAVEFDRRKKWGVRVTNATFYWAIPNIFTNQNNILNFTSNSTNYQIIVPQGLYDIDSLNSYISQWLTNNSLPSNLFVLSGDQSSGLAIIQINNLTTSINFNTSTIRSILGFNQKILGPPTIVGLFYYGDNQATFNSITDILFHTDIASGIYNNANNSNVSNKSDIVLVSNISVPVGSQQITAQFNPPVSDLISGVVSQITVYLTDQDNNPIINTEPWSLLLEVFEI